MIGLPLPDIAMAPPQGQQGIARPRTSALLLALVLLVALLAPLSAGARADGFVRADGTRFVNPDGSTFQIKGISLGNWLMQEGYMFRFAKAKSPRQIEALVERLVGPEKAAAFWTAFRDGYVTKADVDFIAAAGFTTIRVPLHFKLFVDPADPTRFDGPGWALVERLVGWCRQAGLKVILDLHAAPGGQTGVNHDDGPGYPVMFYVPAHRRLTVALWTEIARRFRDDTTVLGYDLLNEPISPYHDTGYLNPRLEPFYRELVAAIRAVDPNHPIMLAGAQWSTSFAMLGPPFADNLAYTYHKFWASTERDGVQEYVNFMALYDVPVFVGETGELTDDWNARFRALNERFGIGWSFWPYKYMETTSAVISVQKPEGWETIAAASALTPDEWTDAALPTREAARAALAAYLEAIRLENGRVNAGYLESLGLKVPGRLGSKSEGSPSSTAIGLASVGGSRFRLAAPAPLHRSIPAASDNTLPPGESLPLSKKYAAILDKQRAWVRDHYKPEFRSRFKTIDGKLDLIQVILDSGSVKRGQTNELQALGVVFGDALAAKMGMRWIEYKDKIGRDPALQYPGTTVVAFPLTMISKRIERGETLNVKRFFEDSCRTLLELKEKYKLDAAR